MWISNRAYKKWSMVVVLAQVLLLLAAPVAKAQGSHAQLRILSVTALDETNPEPGGSDEIFLGATYQTRHHGSGKIAYRKVGQFNDHTTKEFYDRPWILVEIPLTNNPEVIAVKLSLVEEDHGGKDEFLNRLYNYEIENVGSVMAALTAQNEENGSSSSDNDLYIKAVLRVVEKVGKWLWGELTNSLHDDFFEPIPVFLKVESTDSFQSSPREIIVKGHGGTYQIVYDWYLAPNVVTNGQIVNGSGLCLDAHSDQMYQNGAKVQLWTCNRWANQTWRIDEHGRIVNGSGLCLDADSNRMHENGARVQLWTCNGGLSQQWSINGSGQIVNGSGLCLDAHSDQMYQNGAKVQLWPCNGWANQNWTIR